MKATSYAPLPLATLVTLAVRSATVAASNASSEERVFGGVEIVVRRHPDHDAVRPRVSGTR